MADDLAQLEPDTEQRLLDLLRYLAQSDEEVSDRRIRERFGIPEGGFLRSFRKRYGLPVKNGRARVV